MPKETAAIYSIRVSIPATKTVHAQAMRTIGKRGGCGPRSNRPIDNNMKQTAVFGVMGTNPGHTLLRPGTSSNQPARTDTLIQKTIILERLDRTGNTRIKRLFV